MSAPNIEEQYNVMGGNGNVDKEPKHDCRRVMEDEEENRMKLMMRLKRMVDCRNNN